MRGREALLTMNLHRFPPPSAAALAEQLAVGRIAAAAAIMAAPVLSTRLLGADGATAQRVVWLSRMLGVRDGAIGAGTLYAVRRGNPVSWLVAGAVSDAVDAVVLTAAVKQGRARGPVARAILPVSAGAAAAGAWTAFRLRGR